MSLINILVDDWRCDQYRWINQGVTKLPRKNPKLRKLYFDTDTPSGPSKGFQRHGYQLLGNNSVTLVHYLGDEKAAVDFAHRNAKSNSKNFTRTCPSYLKKCEGLVKTQKADLVYKKEVAAMNSESSAVPVYTPRNIQQLRNLRFKKLKQSRISQDALYNLHEIAYDIPGFIWKITTFPDLVCICGLQEIVDELDRVLVLDPSSQLLSYDTTFLLGDFYVSPLIFRHTLFQEAPCIPSMFLIHERKFTETHQEMFKECTKHIPSLKKANCPIVTDKEKAIVKAIESELPSVTILHCWNHIFRDIRLWCRKHGAPAADIALYSDDVLQLFHALTMEEYDKKLCERKHTWDATFEAYYMKEIHPDVPKSIGRCVLEKHHNYNPYSGVTNNQSESLNRFAYAFSIWFQLLLSCYIVIQHS